MENESITISRNELYEQVWKEPVSRLAPKYGISDVGLKKICRKLNVPTPPLGYRYIVDFEMDDEDVNIKSCIVTVEPFLKLVNHKNRTIRKIAITVLGESGHKKAVKLLIHALHDKSFKVRKQAIFYLGELKDRRALRPLMIAMNRDCRSFNACFAIKNILGKNLEHEMITALSDSNQKIRVSAGFMLLNYKFIKPVPLIFQHDEKRMVKNSMNG